MQTRVLAIVALSLTALLLAPSAIAPPDHAAKTETFTAQDVSESFLAANPCTAEEAVIELLYNFSFHVTFWDSGPHAGESRVTGTLTGDATITPTDPEGTVYAGHFTVWFGGSETSKTGVFTETFKINLEGEDGSRINAQGVTHLTFANGEIRSEFATFECR